MSRSNSSASSETDWARVDAQEDSDIDTSETLPLAADFFARATLRRPADEATMTLRVDHDVFVWYRAQGDQWEERAREALRQYAEAHGGT